MHPDLGVDAGELAVEGLGLELEIGVGGALLLSPAVMRRLLDLDQRAAGIGKLAKLRVHDVAEIEDHRLVVVVEFVPQHRGQGGRADGAELERSIGQALRHFPQLGVFQGTTRELLAHDAGLIGLLDLPQNLAGTQAVPRHPTPRDIAVATDAAETFDWIEKPRLAAHGQVKAAVTVGGTICTLLPDWLDWRPRRDTVRGKGNRPAPI